MIPAAARIIESATKDMIVRKTRDMTSFAVILSPAKAIELSSSFFVFSSGGFTVSIFPDNPANLSNHVRGISAFFL